MDKISCKVILLPTDKESQILYGSIHKDYFFNEIPSISKFLTPQYMYIISEIDTIEKGWQGFAYKKDVEGEVFKHFYTTNPWFADARKIIATNDPELIKAGVAKINEDFLRAYCKEPMESVPVVYEPYMTEGWIPSYNNPDNFNLDEPSEMDYRPMLNARGEIIIQL